MPKVNNTRKDRKKELIARIKRGPSYSFNNPPYNNEKITIEQIKNEYKIWIDSWVIPDLMELLKNIPD